MAVIGNYVTLTLSLSHTVPTPGVNVTNVTNSQVEYETIANGSATRVITGYEVFRFGVPMIGEYVNTGRGMNVTISSAVPGALYRITAWALGNNGSRNVSLAVKNVTAGEARKLVGYSVNLINKRIRTSPKYKQQGVHNLKV